MIEIANIHAIRMYWNVNGKVEDLKLKPSIYWRMMVVWGGYINFIIYKVYKGICFNISIVD